MRWHVDLHRSCTACPRGAPKDWGDTPPPGRQNSVCGGISLPTPTRGCPGVMWDHVLLGGIDLVGHQQRLQAPLYLPSPPSQVTPGLVGGCRQPRAPVGAGRARGVAPADGAGPVGCGCPGAEPWERCGWWDAASARADPPPPHLVAGGDGAVGQPLPHHLPYRLPVHPALPHWVHWCFAHCAGAARCSTAEHCPMGDPGKYPHPHLHPFAPPPPPISPRCWLGTEQGPCPGSRPLFAGCTLPVLNSMYRGDNK